jgi:hypothetical protein
MALQPAVPKGNDYALSNASLGLEWFWVVGQFELAGGGGRLRDVAGWNHAQESRGIGGITGTRRQQEQRHE